LLGDLAEHVASPVTVKSKRPDEVESVTGPHGGNGAAIDTGDAPNERRDAAVFIADQYHLGAAGQHRFVKGGFLAKRIGRLDGQAKQLAETRRSAAAAAPAARRLV
jgi:hypothetical protein